MAVSADLTNTQFTISDIFRFSEAVLLEGTAQVIGLDSYTGFVIVPPYVANFVVSGSDFTFTSDGLLYANSGIYEAISVQYFNAETLGVETLLMSGFNLAAEAYIEIRAEERDQSDILGLEQLLMSFDWDIKLSAASDMAGEGTLVGDGLELNFRGDDTINGGQGNDDLFGGAGIDRLIGGKGNDKLAGGDNGDVLIGAKGKDKLFGGDGGDLMQGDDGSDKLFGGTGADTLEGGSGRDTLIGEAGKDELTGGAGADRFVFATGSGKDVITDFDLSKKNEEIKLTDVVAITNWADLRDNHLSNKKGSAIIKDDEGLRIEIEGIKMEDLSKSDFDF